MTDVCQTASKKNLLLQIQKVTVHSHKCRLLCMNNELPLLVNYGEAVAFISELVMLDPLILHSLIT